MSAYSDTVARLRAAPRHWLVTGAAGFIGSNLVEALLAANQAVVGLDNLSTGRKGNCQLAVSGGGPGAESRFTFLDGDICSLETCRQACRGVDFVLHQAAQVSVPASLADPAATFEVNVTGFAHLLQAAHEAKVQRVIYASSCAIYGDSAQLPLEEDAPGRPLSPYAASKLIDEILAGSLARTGALEAIGLRYFNVYGPRQDPRGAYAAVIPFWIASMMRNSPVTIYGDGLTSRDFCHIANVVQANLLAAVASLEGGRHEIINVAIGARTSLNTLFERIRLHLLPEFPHLREFKAGYQEFRPGDVRHSHASIAKAVRLLGYVPTHPLEVGLPETVDWFRRQAE